MIASSRGLWVYDGAVRLAPGATFDRYLIQALLGEGGMGYVYRARDTRLDRWVALKILHPRKDEGDVDTRRAVAAILREARAAAALDHPHAVSIFDLGEHQGVPFLAMEFVVGRPLRSLIGRADLPLAERVRWLIDVARALSAAHRAGIIHLDIKPENIMVREDAVVKVLDFGIARRTACPLDDEERSAPDPRASDASLESDAVAGTPAYMAPEQVRREALDGRTDQFAWGVVAYELLSGKMPWTRVVTPAEAVTAVLREEPPGLGTVCPGVPEVVDEVVMRALAKRPEDRFAAMDDIVDALVGVEPSRPLLKTLPPLLRTGPDRAAWGGVDPRREEVTRTAPELGSVEEALAQRPPGGPPDAALLEAQRRIGLTEGGPPAAMRTSQSGRTEQGMDIGGPASRSLRGAEQARGSRFARLGAWALVAALVGAGGMGARILARGKPPRAAPTAAASTPAAPLSTAITDLPLPTGCTPAALTEYRAGIQALRDGVWEHAHVNFERAYAADPSCAAAAFRLSITGYYHLPISRARKIHQRAVQLREALSERDQRLLDAFDPLIRREPADAQECGARLGALAERFPDDAELAILTATHHSDRKIRLAMAKRGIDLDPRASDGYQMLSEMQRGLGLPAEARATVDACLRAVPQSVDCLRVQVSMLQDEGQCAQVAASARLWIARDPDTAAGHTAFASALADQGSPRGTVEEALRQRWVRLVEPERSQQELLDHALLDALSGDFQSAEQRARALIEMAAGDPGFHLRARPTLLLVETLRETGKTAEAGAIAADFLVRKSAWASSLRTENLDMAVYLFEPRLWQAARRGGTSPVRAWSTARADWFSALQREGFTDEGLLWTAGSAMPADTPAEATAALLTMPPALASSGGYLRPPSHLAGAFAGRALLLAGKVDEALPFLKVAAASCRAFFDPLLHTQAHLWLGQALEHKGDSAGACAAYQMIERRWGNARPRSTTAERAGRRRKALRCPP